MNEEAGVKLVELLWQNISKCIPGMTPRDAFMFGMGQALIALGDEFPDTAMTTKAVVLNDGVLQECNLIRDRLNKDLSKRN